MKLTIISLSAVAIAAAFLISTNSSAQDWLKKDSKHVKLVLDTTHMSAMEVTLKPHEKGPVHTHPANFFYALTDGKITVHYSDGKNETIELKAGDAGYSDPERPHWTENVGTKDVKFLLIELKDYPYKK